MPKKPPPPCKSSIERLNEGIVILNKLKEVGIADTDPGYQQTKALIIAWTKAAGTPDDASAEHIIPFPRFGRKGVLMLPVRAGRQATYVLKAIGGAAPEDA